MSETRAMKSTPREASVLGGCVAGAATNSPVDVRLRVRRMYTLDNMIARDKLREHPAVVGDMNRVCMHCVVAQRHGGVGLTTAV